VIPQYVPAAIEQNRKERGAYGVWRGGDLLARFGFALTGLFIGGIILALPFIPIFEKAVAFVLAAAGWFYPDLIRMMHERRHYKILNRLVVEGEAYQRNRARYVSSADLADDDEPASDSNDQVEAARRAAAQSAGKQLH